MGSFSQNPGDPFTDVDADRLDAFLTSGDADVAWMQVDEIHGLMTALVVGPELVMPSEWTEMIWAGKRPAWKSEDEAAAIMGLLMRMWNDVASRVNAGEGFAPIVEKVWDEAGDEEMVGAGWCEGFVAGVEMRLSSWESREDPELDRLLAPIYAVAGLIDSEEVDALLEEPGMGEALMDAVVESVYKLRVYWMEHGPAPGARGRFGPPLPNEPIRHAPTPGRNDPCPCGSGKKYKLCCGLVH